MGREVRKVPPDWSHPKAPHGEFIPLLPGPYAEAVACWADEAVQWHLGLRRRYGGNVNEDLYGWQPRTGDELTMTFETWYGPAPQPEDYMPAFFPMESATHFMMYENTSEGTPISPAFATTEELARWLADNGASAFGVMTANYDAWLGVIEGSRSGLGMIAIALAPGGQDEKKKK